MTRFANWLHAHQFVAAVTTVETLLLLVILILYQVLCFKHNTSTVGSRIQVKRRKVTYLKVLDQGPRVATASSHPEYTVRSNS